LRRRRRRRAGVKMKCPYCGKKKIKAAGIAARGDKQVVECKHCDVVFILKILPVRTIEEKRAYVEQIRNELIDLYKNFIGE
jgi:transcription elongation factor Elf1